MPNNKGILDYAEANHDKYVLVPSAPPANFTPLYKSRIYEGVSFFLGGTSKE